MFESYSERAERNDANISVSSLMLFPFLVELLLFCSAFYTIKMKAFEVFEFAYFFFFFRDFVIAFYASDSIKLEQQDEFQEASNLH